VKVLDLFAGLEGWSQPWRERGHDVYRVELLEKFPAEWRDIMDFEPSCLPWQPDIILASPPCTAFTVMQIGRNWNKDDTPKTQKAVEGLILLERTLAVIAAINPKYFVIENPRGKMRKMKQLAHLERRTVTYCQFGERRMKPTDLWGRFPPSLVLPPPCKNGAPCHDAAPRGSMTATQGMASDESAKIPYALSLLVLKACAKDLGVPEEVCRG
jgi:hypothetical protein